MRKKFRNIKQFKPKRKIHKKKVSMMVISSALASALFLTPIAPIVENGQLIGFEQQTAEAASLADVNLLTDKTIDAELGNIEGSEDYTLDLILTGTGLADVDLVNSEPVAVFHAPELTGDLSADTASIRVQILPITMDDLPALNTTISNLTGSLNTAVGDLVGVIDGILSNPVTSDLINVSGLEELQTALEALNNLDSALTDVLEYNTEVPANVLNNGTITVDFSEGLGNHLDTTVKAVVLPILRDISTAISNLSVEIIGGTISVPLAPVEALLQPVNELISELTDEVLSLTNGTISAQVIGRTTIEVPATIDRNTNASGTIPIDSGIVDRSVVDLDLLTTSNTATTIEIPSADTTAPVITPIENVDAIENQLIEEITVITDEPSDISVEGLPEGIVYDPETQTMNGAPIVEDWGATEEVRVFEVTVTATDDAENSSEETFEINVQRDTDGDGNPDVTDPDDDGDGYTDEEEKEAGTDPKDDSEVPGTEIEPIGGINEITDQTVVENEAIEDVIVEAEDPEAVVSVDEATLPEGLTFDATTNTISGTPVVTDWGETEETRELTITITAENPDGSSASETFSVTVQRDTDGDGEPDVTDPDDDGDGYNDEEEEEAGTDPKDDSEVPGTEITPIGGINEISDQTVVEYEAIEEVQIVPEDPEAVVSVDETALPEGLTFDAETNTISGTPAITDWGATEETRELSITVTAENPDGSSTSETFSVTVQRDTDGDGEPDVTDPDDDGDGYTDEEEEEAGTDPKDDTDTPDTTAPVITPIEDVMAVEGQPIENITVETDEPSEIVVDGLPDGTAYDPETQIISGTPVIEDWDDTEEERVFEITITATDEAGNTSTETFEMIIQRDTDSNGDSDPGVTDPDDEQDEDSGNNDSNNDGSGEEDGEKDTTPPVITPIPDGSGIENEPIEDIVIETDEPSQIIVEGLPDGVTYDPETGIISGTPTINDWSEGETERTYTVTITAEDEAGNRSSIDFNLTIERDLNRTGGAEDNLDTKGGQSVLPKTGETQNIFTGILGILIASAGSLLFFWSKKEKA